MKRKAKIFINRKVVLNDGAIIQAVVWELPEPLPGSTHRYKYRFYFGKDGRSLVRYDNERGKGDHRHIADGEEPCTFTDLDTLYADFLKDVERYG
jgi:uncharacterized protein DUF6516